MGFKDALLGNQHWLEGTQLVVISNTQWVGETMPCLTYGMRGMIALSIEVNTPLLLTIIPTLSSQVSILEGSVSSSFSDKPCILTAIHSEYVLIEGSLCCEASNLVTL